MKNEMATLKLQVAAVSDQGLNEQRLHNEDSFHTDAENGIFVVADGVGGAQAGEVASQMAVGVLAEAFNRRIKGGDAEDALELAIQQANASIHRMSRTDPELSTMATTIVALHVDDQMQATIGHVGDSRIYRSSPEGELRRETDDHSIVEEEVRAGRMTPAQAAHHPGRNVISRALGADSIVEVDLKSIACDEGTLFLLCSDGITRHIPDDELHDLLRGSQSLE
ncbi:MAG: PP2C family protein-serine/threonine phosphatase, partial [Pyrinomonadaceae bacterium]